MTEDVSGIGCRPLASVLGILLGFAAGAAIIGLSLIGDSGCTGLCEKAGFAAYGAGLPVSALFAVAGGSDLVLAYLTDMIVWVAAAVGLARLVERRSLRPWKAATAAIAVALVYGVVVSSLVERA